MVCGTVSVKYTTLLPSGGRSRNARTTFKLNAQYRVLLFILNQKDKHYDI